MTLSIRLLVAMIIIVIAMIVLFGNTPTTTSIEETFLPLKNEEILTKNLVGAVGSVVYSVVPSLRAVVLSGFNFRAR